MGICKASDKNNAMLAGLTWRLLTNQNSLWTNCLSKKYGNSINLLVSKTLSFWESVMAGWNICKIGVLWNIVKGNAVNI